MGLVFGKIEVETRKYEVLHTCPDYEIRMYVPSVVAQVTYDPAQMRGNRDGGFMVLANYIGALGNPQNTRPRPPAEKIAMAAPVATSTEGSPAGGGTPEKIAMTAPVITTTTGVPEEIAMAAPVVTSGDQGTVTVTMQFVLPSKYTKAEEAPTPLDGRVAIIEEGEGKYAVVRFSGVATEKLVEEKVERLRRSLERDGHRVTGRFLLARYNPPWTLPPFRTNEVMLPVE